MAKKRARKSVNGKAAAAPKEQIAEATTPATPSPAAANAKQAGRAGKKRTKKSAPKASPRRHPRTAAKKRVTTKRPARATQRRTFTAAARQRILETARRERLTGTKVAKRFGISQVTYYLWRKKAGSSRGRGEGAVVSIDKDGIVAEVRQQVQAKIAEMLPEIIEQEVAATIGPTSRRR